jgi:uncharacterized membrane protein YqhA
MPWKRAKVEQLFERWLWRLRLIAVLPVLMSLLGSMITFVFGTIEIIHSLNTLFKANALGMSAFAKELGKLVGGIDFYLIGIALMIFGYGIYELIISDIEAARPSGKENSLLDIRSLNSLKEKLVKVIVVALIVTAFKKMIVFPLDGSANLLIFSGSVLLLSLSAYLVTISSRDHH